MTFIETCIIVLVIGFVAMLVAYVTIAKFFEEKKKESDRAIQAIKSISEAFEKSIEKLLQNQTEV